MANNYWMGGTELVIVPRLGSHEVIEVERYGDHTYEDTVFVGEYSACVEFCEQQVVAWMESLR